MSTGGSVPQQGTTMEALSEAKQEQAEQERKRGPRGRVGLGTPGTRVKAAWQYFNRKAGAPKNMVSLRKFASEALHGKRQGPGWPEDIGPLQANAEEWLLSKRSGGTDEQRKVRRERIKTQRSINLTAKMARRGKGKQQKKAALETSRTMHL